VASIALRISACKGCWLKLRQARWGQILLLLAAKDLRKSANQKRTCPLFLVNNTNSHILLKGMGRSSGHD
jgi:predicted Rdx family selenoprotein